ncbi:MAG: hypothetical protein ACR2NY_06320 [Alphaproteobacteria bacterium]
MMQQKNSNKPSTLTAKNTPAVDKNHSYEKPDHLPEKFWDKEKSTVRLEELTKSYRLLEQQYSRLQQNAEAVHHHTAEKLQWQKERDVMESHLRDAAIFGGNWQDRKSSIIAWSENMFGKKSTSDMMATPEGVAALQWIRQGFAEPHLVKGNSAGRSFDEAGLRRMMRSPDYWRDKKPNILQKVEKGFDRLYNQSTSPRFKT